MRHAPHGSFQITAPANTMRPGKSLDASDRSVNSLLTSNCRLSRWFMDKLGDRGKRMRGPAICLALMFAGMAPGVVLARSLDRTHARRPQPASMEEIAILNHGARINGFVYLSSGAGPHP